MNTYHRVFLGEPRDGGEGVAVLEREEDLDFLPHEECSYKASIPHKQCEEEIVVIKGKVTVSF